MPISGRLIKNIKNISESETIEFKQASGGLPRSFWETYSSFSNTNGGFIILGIEENPQGNKITGVNNARKIKDDLFNLLSNKNKVSYNSVTNEDILIEKIENKDIIIVRVHPAPFSVRPVYLNSDMSATYIRTGDGDRRAKDEELLTMHRNAKPDMDGQLVGEFYTIDNDIDLFSLTSFKARVSDRYPDKRYDLLGNEEFLLQIGAVRKNRRSQRVELTRGILLFLGKYNSIKEYFPSYHLDYFNCLRDNQRWTDRIATDEPYEYEMNIYNFYSMVNEKLKALSFSEFSLDEENIRISKGGYSAAIREALVNMLAHADYELGSPSSKIEIYKGWITFANPGTMLIPANTFFKGGRSAPRNEVIMKLFRLIGSSERQGFGGPEIMRNSLKNNFRPPEITTNIEQTILKIWQVDLVDSYPELTQDEKDVFAFILKSGRPVSRTEVQEELKMSDYKSINILNELMSTDKIERIGKGPSTKYQIELFSDEKLVQMQMMLDEIYIHRMKNPKF